MRLAIYKPNSKNTGVAASFGMTEDSRKGTYVMFINAVMQASWNDAAKTGSFSANAKNPEKSCNVMFNLLECGEMIAAFNNNTPKTFYHKTADRTVSISMTPWLKEGKIKGRAGAPDETYPIHAFGIRIVIDGAKTFSIPLEPGEIENLKWLIVQGMMRNYGKEEAKYSNIQDDVRAEEDSVSQ